MSDGQRRKTSRFGFRGKVAPLTRHELRDVSGIGVLALAWVSLPAIFGFWLLAQIGGVSEWYRGWEDRNGLGVALLLYIVLFAATSGLGLLPTYAQAFLGGWVFGPIAGS